MAYDLWHPTTPFLKESHFVSICKMYTKNDLVFEVLVNTDFWLTILSHLPDSKS